MSEVWHRVEKIAEMIKDKLANTADDIPKSLEHEYSWENKLYTSNRYRRGHVEIVDHRENYKIYILHCTIFPHYNDPSPIWGFDAVCGPNKITGAFHDFSLPGYANHPMAIWWKERSGQYAWHKPRELPDWAKQIFSENMVAAGNVKEQDELDSLLELASNSLDYYLANVGHTQESLADYHQLQNKYCYYQKQNPHVIKSMVSMGIPEPVITKFVDEVLFPETK